MVVCSRKPENYSYSKVTKAYPITEIKIIHIDGKVMECVFSRCPRGRKGYESLRVKARGSKFINHICITFS